MEIARVGVSVAANLRMGKQNSPLVANPFMEVDGTSSGVGIEAGFKVNLQFLIMLELCKNYFGAIEPSLRGSERSAEAIGPEDCLIHRYEVV